MGLAFAPGKHHRKDDKTAAIPETAMATSAGMTELCSVAKVAGTLAKKFRVSLMQINRKSQFAIASTDVAEVPIGEPARRSGTEQARLGRGRSC